MPELAEVEYYRKQWDPGQGETVLRVQTHPAARIYRDAPASAFEGALPGRRFLAGRAHGKQMLFEFSGGLWLALHLGMTGRLRAASAGHAAARHEHLVLSFASVSLVFEDPRMFGRVRLDLVDGGRAPRWWLDLPPQPTDPRFTKARVRDFVRRFPRTPLKTLLLDQRGFPGIGNWMADEICWRLRLAPQTPAGELDEAVLGALWREVRRVSRGALRAVGADWGDLPDSWLMNHRWRDGGTCPRRGCRHELVRGDLRGRTTCWCPACQGPPQKRG